MRVSVSGVATFPAGTIGPYPFQYPLFARLSRDGLSRPETTKAYASALFRMRVEVLGRSGTSVQKVRLVQQHWGADCTRGNPAVTRTVRSTNCDNSGG